MNKKTYYHISREALPIGFELNPIVYGDRIMTHGLKPEHFNQLTKEIVFERVRRMKYPHFPSRLYCIYLLNSLEATERYRSSQGYIKDGVIHEVELMGSGIMGIADLTHLNCNHLDLDEMTECAELYYKGTTEDNENAEWLYEGYARVVRQVADSKLTV